MIINSAVRLFFLGLGLAGAGGLPAKARRQLHIGNLKSAPRKLV